MEQPSEKELFAKLQSAIVEDKRIAVFSLGALKNPSREAIDIMMELMVKVDQDSQVRDCAVFAIGDMLNTFCKVNKFTVGDTVNTSGKIDEFTLATIKKSVTSALVEIVKDTTESDALRCSSVVSLRAC